MYTDDDGNLGLHYQFVSENNHIFQFISEFSNLSEYQSLAKYAHSWQTLLQNAFDEGIVLSIENAVNYQRVSTENHSA